MKMTGLEPMRIYAHYYLWRKEGFGRIESGRKALRYIVMMIRVSLTQP